MIIHFDDFTGYTTVAHGGWTGGGSIVAAAGRFGTPAYRIPQFSNGDLALPGLAEVFVNHAFRLTALSGVPRIGVSGLVVGTTGFVGLTLNMSTLALEARRGSHGTADGTLLATASTPCLLATQHHLEWRLLPDASTGRLVVYLDGNLVIDFTGNTGTGDITAFRVYLSNTGGNSVDLSHLLLMDPSGGVMDGFIGDQRMVTHYPTSDHQQAFSRSAGSDNFALVDETPSDADTTYVQGANGNEDLYGFPAVGVVAKRVHAVCGVYRARKTDAGAASYKPVLLSDEVSEDGAEISPATDYGYAKNIWYTDPKTEAEWAANLTNVNAAKLGQRAIVP